MAADNIVFYFPIKSPKHAIFRKDFDAIKQLELWLVYQKYWTEHKPSMTVSVQEEEWMRVGSWVFDNFEFLSGISFLPFSDHSYVQAPFQAISEEEYKKWMEKMPTKVDWSKLSEYEKEDHTVGSQELGCMAGAGDGGRVSEGCVI
jgi:ribonucleoside-diphosphate reductase alpha chain